MDEVVQRAARLGRGFGVDAVGVTEDRIRRTVVVLGRVAQERVEVADRREPQPVHDRVLRDVGKLIDVVVGEVARRQLDRGAVPVGVGPAAVRHDLRYIVEMDAMGEDGVRRALRGRRGGVLERERGAAGDDVLIARPGDRRVSGVTRDREAGRRGETGQRSEIVLPSAPHRGVAARPEEGILQHRGIGERRRIVAAGRRVVQRLIGLAAPVRRLVHHLAIALVQVERLQDVEIVLIFDVAVGVFRRQLDVGDQRILRVRRTDLARRDPGDDLVLADAGKRVSAERDGPVQDLDSRGARVRIRRHG